MTLRILKIPQIRVSSSLLIILALVPCLLMIKGVFTTAAQAKKITTQLIEPKPEPQLICIPYDITQFTDGFTPTHLKINKINLDLDLTPIENPNTPKKLIQGAVYYPLSSSKVNPKQGRVVIYAKDGVIDKQSNKRILPGDQVVISSKEQTAIYEITPTQATPNEYSKPLAPSNTPVLTIINTGETFSYRGYILHAKLLRIDTNCYETYQ